MLTHGIPKLTLGCFPFVVLQARKETILLDLPGTLKQLRLRKGLSLRGVAHSLGMSHTRLADYERGRSSGGKPATPTRRVLMALADLYGYPVQVLLDLAGYPEVEPERPLIPSELQAEAQELEHILRNLPAGLRRLLMTTARAFHAEALHEKVDTDASEATQ